MTTATLERKRRKKPVPPPPEPPETAPADDEDEGDKVARQLAAIRDAMEPVIAVARALDELPPEKVDDSRPYVDAANAAWAAEATFWRMREEAHPVVAPLLYNAVGFAVAIGLCASFASIGIEQDKGKDGEVSLHNMFGGLNLTSCGVGATRVARSAGEVFASIETQLDWYMKHMGGPADWRDGKDGAR